MRTILHIDMDAFFAAVEFLHHPEWKGKPLIVGSLPNERGVVSTCSYEARKFGVHSAMPSKTAYQLCPQAIFTHPHMKLYEEVSKKAFSIFEHYTPYVEGVSIDEAFLDITGSIHLYSTARKLGEALMQEIRDTCGITCSVGIAKNRLLAKIGSEVNKPNGLKEMPNSPDEISSFLSTKPISVLWGIGQKTCSILKPYGLTTCLDIQRLVGSSPDEVWREGRAKAPPSLVKLLGEASSATLSSAAFGISDDNVYWQNDGEKSVSREFTFDVDEANRDVVRGRYLEIVVDVAQRFRTEQRWARTAKLKLRDEKFQTITRQIALEYPARDDFAFREAALKLFDATYPKGTSRIIRLIGFGVTNIQNTPENGEISLFESEIDIKRKKRESLSTTLDNLRTNHQKYDILTK